MKADVLKLLKKAEGYVSGQELCGYLGVSRTAVWKVINQLKEEGYQIEAVRNKGYRLVSAADVITEAELATMIDTSWVGKSLAYYEETDSTNIRARALAEDGAPGGCLVVADFQNAGRGRRGRNWVSPRGTGIWMSLILRPRFGPQAASMLTLVAALAVAGGIRRAAGVQALIKWPNDLVANGKKLCGILTEMSTEADQIRYVVVGMGVNANMVEFPEGLEDKATSLRLESGCPAQRSQVIAAVMELFERYYEIFERTEDMSGLIDQYNSQLVNCNRQVTVLDPAAAYEGVALGIDRDGCLLVERPDKTISHVIAGEVSVRGIYGYV